jgi:tetratricopeptide (TPR) repeat protein
VVLALLLAAVTAIAYWPVTGHEFVGYDDPRYVTRNENVQRGFGPGSVEYAFQSDDGGNWHPLTWFSHMLDVELFGIEPSGHHASNASYHILATILLFLVLHSWTGAVWRSAFVAAAFALHPLHVESVAWVAERKDTLSAVMWMVSLAAYGWYARRPRLDRYLLLLVTFGLGLMSKPMLVTLPLVLLLLDLWPLKRISLERGGAALRKNLRLLLEKLPLLAISALASFVAVTMQKRQGAVMATAMIDLGERINNALLTYVSYLGKTLWPTNMAVFYPYPASFPLIKVLAAGLFLLGISVYSLVALRRRPYLAVGWFWFLGTLVPVIGLVQVGAQSMADRYTYIPLIGIFIVVAWGVVELLGTRVRAYWLITCCTVVLALWLVGTRTQLRHWENSEVLFKHAIAVTTGNFMMHHNLGVVLQDQGRVDEAIDNYREAVRINGWTPSRLNLGVLLSRKGEHSEAIVAYRRALEVNPNNSLMHNNLANALVATGEIEEALDHFRAAVRLNPRYYQAQSNLALNLVRVGRADEAIAAARAALRVNPRFGQAHNTLGMALAQKGRPLEAIASYREALRLIPDWPPAMRRLAWLYATYPEDEIRSGAEAVRLASRASKRTGNKDALMLDTLAAAHAENGDFNQAVAGAERALAAAQAAKDGPRADDIAARLELYRLGQPYRDSP